MSDYTYNISIDEKKLNRYDDTITNTIHLEPCPFCGGVPVISVDGGIRVRCTNCNASSMALSGDFHVVERVVSAWNERHKEEVPNE